jgi:hypothetical protein
MKATAEKSTHVTPASLQVKPARPFFPKAGGGDYFAPAHLPVQTKLAVSKPGDKYEAEADHMAGKVMRMSGSGKQKRENELESQPEKKLQRKESASIQLEELPAQQQGDGHTQMANEQTAATIRSKTSGGQPLPVETRSFMEPRFGNDFSNVRIHQDQGAAQLNSQLNARAFTYQNHIFFGEGQYKPQSPQGKHLLAHELTHVVQQGGAKGLNDKSETGRSQRDETVSDRPSQTGSQVIQRGLLDDIKEGAGAVAGAVSGIINNVRQAIGGGIAAATTWIRNVASGIGAGISAAWTFINNLASTARLGVAAAWTLIQGIASRIGQGITSASAWIKGLATKLNMGITNAWNFIQTVASSIAMNITNAWNFIQNLASGMATGITSAWNFIQAAAKKIAMNITNTWSFIQKLASRLAMGITNAWKWVQTVASNIARSITSAWDWIQTVASKIGMHLPASWNWVKVLASRLAMGITNSWNWVQTMASKFATGITNAWNRIQSMASNLAMRITNAWNWIQSMASRLATGITNAWNWVQSMASKIAMRITNAWNWVQAMASRLAMAITNAWNWVQSMASRIIMGIIKAWNWIQSVASKIAMAINKAWNWLLAMAAKLAISVITIVWNWIQTFARKLAMMITKAVDWVIAMALKIVKGIISAWNWLVNLARKLVKSLLEAWDWYWHAPDIAIATDLNAADGSGKSRKKVGVGEKVTFTGSKSGDWSATGGSPLTSAGTLTFAWTAPVRGASVTIRLTSGKYTRSVIINVLEPKEIEGKNIGEKKFKKRFLGAFMFVKFHYFPKSVSFGNVQSKEVSGPASNIRGYFEGRKGKFEWHDSKDTFYSIDNNNVDSATDEAGFWGYPSPWKKGRYDWVIPNHFKVNTEGGDGKKFTDVKQIHTIEGTDGTAKITKAGAEVERTP